MLRVESLQVNRSGTTVCQVDQLEILPGERLSIIGTNGVGKTTLLRTLAGLESHFSGTIETTLAQRERIYVHQDPYLFRGSVLNNVTFGLRARRVESAEQQRRARQSLARLGCDHLASRPAARLSAGERRRVALARALVLEPPLLLLDEPFAELDPAGIDLVCETLALIGSAVIVASPMPPPAGFAGTVTELLRPKVN